MPVPVPLPPISIVTPSINLELSQFRPVEPTRMDGMSRERESG